MLKQLKAIFVTLSLIVITGFVIIVVNQTAQVVDLADRVNPMLGTVVLYGLILIFFFLIAIPVYLYFRLPSHLTIPENISSPEYQTYISKLSDRLKKNKYIKGNNLSVNTEEEISAALSLLHFKADEDSKKTASIVFVSTAVSQSGKLDGFIVLILLTKLIWRIAHIYNQRPSLREMLQLYANVAGTSLVAMELEEIDIGEQIEPIIDNVFGASLAGAIPGLQQISAFVFSCIMEGSINAYLTLRVGAVTKGYCGSLIKPERKSLRRSASLEAARHLGRIIKESGQSVIVKIKKYYGEKFNEKKDNAKGKLKSLWKFKNKPEE